MTSDIDTIISSNAFGPDALLRALREGAAARIQAALVTAVVAAEAPAVLARLRVLLRAAEDALPTLEAAEHEALAADEEQAAEVARLEVDFAEVKRTVPEHRREYAAAALALQEAEKARTFAGGTAPRLRITQAKLADARKAVRALEGKIAALEALPAPDAALLAALREA